MISDDLRNLLVQNGKDFFIPFFENSNDGVTYSILHFQKIFQTNIENVKIVLKDLHMNLSQIIAVSDFLKSKIAVY